MNVSRIASAYLAVALGAVVAEAGEKYDPAARAKVVAPFVEAQTVAVAHVDLSRVAIDPLFDTVARLIPQTTPSIKEVRSRFSAAQAGLTKLGVHDLYLVFSLSRMPPQSPLGLLVLKPGVSADSVRAVVPDFKAATRQVGEVLVLADDEDLIRHVGSIKPEDRPELAQAFEAAGDTAFQVAIVPPRHYARVIEEMQPELPSQVGGGPSTIVTQGALWAAVGIDLPPKATAKLILQSRDAGAAEALARKIGDAFRFLGGLPETKKLVPTYEQVIAKLAPRVEKDRVAIRMDESATTGLLRLLQPPIEQARRAAGRAQSMNNLKQIGLAMHNYYDTWKSFPPAAKCDKNGKPLLSWRVLILPYIEQNKLFDQFHLDEPWDSPHNKTLIEKMPRLYRSPLSKLSDPTRTNYVLPVGPSAAFDGANRVELKSITDGTSNTIMTLEVDDSHSVIWTRADDLPFDPKDPLKGLGGLIEGGFQTGFMDGSVRFIAKSIAPETLKALITPRGREVIDPSTF